MDPFLSVNGREFHALAVERPEALELPFSAVPYPCMIWAGEPTPEEFKAELAHRLIGSDCRYAVCGGAECRAWETAVDLAFVASDPDFDQPEDRHVMTSSHDGEPPDEVAFFFVMLTNFDDHEFHRYLVLVVRTSDAERHEVMARIEHYTRPTLLRDEAG